MNHNTFETAIVQTSDLITAEIRDGRSSTMRIFADLDEAQRESLAQDAWTVGLRAIGNAYSAAQESRIADIGQSLMSNFDQQLRRHTEYQQQTITAVIGRFFDPNDGQVTQRLAAFVADEGVLARQLNNFLGPQNSVLAQSLAKQVGETSPLFKKLSPTESDGLVKVLEAQLGRVMGEGHEHLVRALDPLAEDGAVARFLRSLREELKGAENDRNKQLTTALAALDANDENSLLSRMCRDTDRARLDVMTAMNPEAPNSPLNILKTTLTTLLKEQGSQQIELARQQQERQIALEKEVREAIARMEAKRAYDQKSPRGGLEYEDAVTAFLSQAVVGAPCTLEAIGTRPGAVGRSKTGDAVIRFTAESAFAGAGVVFEAKREHGYTPQKALDELDAARKNRNAVAGVFVLARSHAGRFPRFARFGSNVLLTWDDEDSSTDPYLHAGILLGMALVTRAKILGDAGDIKALRDVEDRIVNELTRLQKMEKHNESIARSSEGIAEEIRKARKAFDLLLRNAQSTLRALRIDLQEEEVERLSPISLPEDESSTTTMALPGAGGNA